MTTDERQGPSADRRARHHVRRRGPGRPIRSGSVIVVVLAVGFFFGPSLAYVVGDRPRQIENHKATPFPSIHDGWAVFPELGTWATDHLNGRKSAVKANADLSEKIFREPPAVGGQAGSTQVLPGAAPPRVVGPSAPPGLWPQVIQGSGGWLFLGLDMQLRCAPAPIPQTLARMAQLSAAVTASGRHFEFAIAPDKSSAYGAKLPRNYAGKTCAQTFTSNFWKAFDASPTPGYVDVRNPLLALSRTSKEPVYRPKDTHWSDLGSVAYAQSLVAGLAPALATGTTVRSLGQVQQAGDLSVLLGNPQHDTLAGYDIVRRGVSTSPLKPFANTVTHVASTTTSAALYQPKTLMLGDSFTAMAEFAVAPYFANLDLVNTNGFLSNPDSILADITQSSTIVLEIAERAGITGLDALMGTPGMLDRVISVLLANPKK
jgi:alginate O-acetyltransferase complex protein AlgJ